MDQLKCSIVLLVLCRSEWTSSYILPIEIVCSSAKAMLVMPKFHILVWEQLQIVSDEVLGRIIKRKFICGEFLFRCIFIFRASPLLKICQL